MSIHKFGTKTSSGPLPHPSPSPSQHAGCSYPGEVSRVREVRALEKCRVSHSFTSRSRICGEETERGSEVCLSAPRAPQEPSAQGQSLAQRHLPQKELRRQW